MKQTAFCMLMLGLCASTALLATPRDFTPARPSYDMPEPGGVAELATCVVGLGLFALRRRKNAA